MKKLLSGWTVHMLTLKGKFLFFYFVPWMN
jgi:hypothetical protein